MFFRTLKTGCEIEGLQLTSMDRLEPALAFYMIISWRVMFLTMLGRECPDIPCECVFEKEEWEAIYIVSHQKKPPNKPPHLNEIIRLLATFGGFLNRKGDGFPGPKSVWIGLMKSKEHVLAIRAYKAMEN